MVGMTFSFQDSSQSCDTVIEEWPLRNHVVDRYTNIIRFKLQPSKRFPESMLPLIAMMSKESIELQIYNIPKWLFFILRTVLRRYKNFVKVLVINQRKLGVKDSSLPKHALVLLYAKTKLGPTFALCCNATANFYCSHAIERLLLVLKKTIIDNSDISKRQLIEITREHLPVKETFEEQYIDSMAVQRTQSLSQRQVYEHSVENEMERFNRQTRIKEYEDFISNQEYMNNNPIRETIIKNKLAIKKYQLFTDDLKKLINLDNIYTGYVEESLMVQIKSQLDKLNEESEDLKCKLCYTNWIDCMFPECKHFQYCKTCVGKIYREYSMYQCPLCKQFNSYVIVDVDID